MRVTQPKFIVSSQTHRLPSSIRTTRHNKPISPTQESLDSLRNLRKKLRQNLISSTPNEPCLHIKAKCFIHAFRTKGGFLDIDIHYNYSNRLH